MTLTEAPAATPAGPPPAVQPDATAASVPGWLRISLAVSLVFTVLMVFLAVYAVGLSALQEQRSQHQLYAKLRGLLSPSSEIAPPVGGVISPGTPVALISAPDAGIDRDVVVEGTSSADLLAGPGLLRDSALPGQYGQSVLIGKSVTAGSPFRRIDRLAIGDPITVTTAQGTFHFTVIDHRATSSAPPEVPAGGALLTLVSATGSGWLSALAPEHLLYVDAKLAGAPVAAPPGRPLAVPASELPGNDDPGVWPYLILWLQGLLLAAVAVVWSWTRWGRRQTWLVGTPLLVAVMWGVADTAMRLVP
ncbi:MAG TPA: class E sortase, partial [Mycobacteriales bacterium]|nr:class E sortase [Mycobacteriales bacterium]